MRPPIFFIFVESIVSSAKLSDYILPFPEKEVKRVVPLRGKQVIDRTIKGFLHPQTSERLKDQLIELKRL